MTVFRGDELSEKERAALGPSILWLVVIALSVSLLVWQAWVHG